MLPTPNKLSLFFVLFITMIGMNAAAQTYKFEYFTEYHGLPTKFIYTVDQDMNGYLITGTDKGLYRYDGFEFTKINHHDSLVNPFILCSYMDNEGVIWFGHQDGTVSRYLNGDWSSVPMADDEKSRVNDIGADDNGNVWFLTLDQGLKWIDSEDKIHAYNLDLSDYFIYSMQLDGEYIWLGADVGLLKCDISGQSDVEYVDDVQGQVFDISKFGDELLVATDDRGVYALHESRTGMSVRSIQCGDDNLEDYTIQHIHRDKNNSMWLGTKRSGLLEFRFDQQGNCIKKISYNEGGLEGSTSVGQSFHDREGNLWIATEDNGLIRLLNDYFSFYRLTEFEELDEIQANIVYPTGDNELWIGTESNVVRCEISPWRIIEVYDVQDGLKEANYLSVCSDDQGTVWVGNGLGQLFFKRADEEKFTEFELVRNAEGKFINDIVFNKGRVFVASSIGVFVIQDFELINHFTMSDGLPHDWVSDISIDKKGYLWFSTRSRFLSYYVVGDSEIILEDDVFLSSSDNSSVAFDSANELWVGTKGAGVFRIKENEIITYNSKNSDLFKDFVNVVHVDKKNHVWAAHRGGLSRIDYWSNKVKVYDPVKGENLNFIENSLSEDEDGNLWFGTDRGILRYSPDLDKKNNVKPLMDIEKIVIDEKEYDAEETIRLPYKRSYKVEFSYLGLSFKESSEVTYQYKLEGLDEEWSKASKENSVSMNINNSGTYTFRVQAFNEDGVRSEEIKEITFVIDRPFWRKWWFYLGLALFVFGTVRGIIKRREQILIRNQEYLQKELDARTFELVEQKANLEKANNDITDSIEYAKKIQTAILPAPNTLNKMFNNAFVFYKPRDIVSGDFYWVQEQGDYILLACADCTGHGVPGAFMSLIGSALLKEISTHSNVRKPSDALYALDEEINKMLNKKNSRFTVSDGMDISVVEYHKISGRLRIASAKRPFIVIQNGEEHVVTGDRHSVGGYEDEFTKVFTDHEYNLNEGDRLYLYSDGFVDQFGGERGKKLKHRGFVDLLRSIRHTEMSTEGRALKKAYKNWLNNYEQIDDIIVIGIEL